MCYVQDVNGAIYRTPWKTVYEQFKRWKKQGIFEKMNYDITKYSRSRMGRNEEPSACIVIGKNDRKRGGKGCDGGKKIKGRKRYQGFILSCYVGAATVMPSWWKLLLYHNVYAVIIGLLRKFL